MDVVLDPFDPTGMFSKAGRASLEMYQMILQRDKILYNKKSVHVPSKLTSFNPQAPIFSNAPHQKPSPIANNTQKSESLPPKANTTPQPFSKMLSRELLMKLQKDDRRFGMYNPKYNLIFRRSPLYEEENNNEKKKEVEKIKSPTVKKRKKTMSCHVSNDLSKETNELNLEVFKPHKIIGPTPLNLQLGRDRKLNYSQDVSEKRFEPLPLPEIYTKSHKVPVIHLQSALGRSRNNFKRDDCAKGLEYKPNFHLVWPKSAVKIPDFSKALSRKGMENSSICYNGVISPETSFISNSGQKALKTPIFSKMLAREKSLDDTSRISVKKVS